MPDRDGSRSLSLGAPIHCGCAAGSHDEAHPYICGEESTPGCINTDHIHRVAFTARWVGGGDGCSHYNVSLTISTSLDGNTFDEEPAAVLGLHGALPSTLPLALALTLALAPALALALALALPPPLPPPPLLVLMLLIVVLRCSEK